MPDATGPSGASAEAQALNGAAPASLRRRFVVAGWVIVALLGLVALLRLSAWDSLGPLIALDALTMIIYLPAWVVAVGACFARSWWLVAAAVVIVGAQVAFVAPEFQAATPLPSWAQHAKVIRVFDANIDKSYLLATGYVQAIEQDRPDVVALEEFTPAALGSMEDSGLLASYPYRCVYPAFGAVGFLVASRWRMTGCELESASWDGEEVPYMVEATLYSPAGPVALRVLHTLAPLPSSWNEWSAALAAAKQSVRASGDAHMLMVGDFNATWGNAAFVDLLHEGLTDGAAARGDALEMSWPNGAITPPVVRIDHVLTGSRLAVIKIDTAGGFGSDHRYLVATVAVRA